MTYHRHMMKKIDVDINSDGGAKARGEFDDSKVSLTGVSALGIFTALHPDRMP